MKHSSASLPDPRAPKPRLTKIGLLVLFLLGAALLFMGYRGQEAFSRSGYTGEEAYGAVYQLSQNSGAFWDGTLSAELEALTKDERASLRDAARALVSDCWQKQQDGSAERVAKMMDEGGEEVTYKLLYAAYFVHPPKINPTNRKLITAVPEKEQRSFRLRLLKCALDESAALPEQVVKAVGEASGSGRQALLFQAYFVSSGSTGEDISESVKLFKQNVRDKQAQLAAFESIAEGRVSLLWQLVVTHSRTVMLTGIVLMADALLLAAFMLSERLWRFDVKWLTILLVVDFLVFFQLMPLIHMLRRVFFPEGKPSLGILERLYTNEINLTALKNTLLAALCTMVLGTLIAFPLAFLVGRTNLYGKKLFRTLFVITYMVPPYVGAMAWLRLMNPNVGTINQWLRALFALGDEPGPLNVYTLPGMVWVLTTFYYPYAFITISRAMEKMDPSLEEASRISGASAFKTVIRITLPMMTPSLVAGALLVFVAAASCYGIPSIVGLPGSVHTVTTRIVEYGQTNIDDATALSVFLLLVSLIFLVVSDVVLAKRKYITVSGKSVRPATVDLGRWRWPLTILVSLFTVLVAVLPFFTILSTSLKIDIGKSLWAGGNLTMDNWKEVLRDPQTLHCLSNSLIYAAVAATVGMLIACAMGYFNGRTQLRGRSIPSFLIALGSGTPSVVIALSLIMTMTGNFGLDIHNTAYILIMAYLIK